MANKALLSFAAKILKLILNIIIVVMYRHGDTGFFLGASFNKNRDAETLASGVYIGYLIYNIAVIISSIFDRESIGKNVTETVMNGIGFILWIVVSGVVIHFWLRFIPANHYLSHNPAPVGIAMGALTIINSILYLADTLVALLQYQQNEKAKY